MEFAKQVNFKGIRFPVQKNTMQKLENKIKSTLAYLIMKRKIQTILIP